MLLQYGEPISNYTSNWLGVHLMFITAVSFSSSKIFIWRINQFQVILRCNVQRKFVNRHLFYAFNFFYVEKKFKKKKTISVSHVFTNILFILNSRLYQEQVRSINLTVVLCTFLWLINECTTDFIKTLKQ